MPLLARRARRCCAAVCRRFGRSPGGEEERALVRQGQEPSAGSRARRLNSSQRQEAEEAAIAHFLSLNEVPEQSSRPEDAALAADAALARALAEVWAMEVREGRSEEVGPRPVWLPAGGREAAGTSSSSSRLPRSTCPVCMEAKEAFPLGACGHCLCVRCAVTYVRTAIGNASEEVKPEGIRCALHCSGCPDFVTPDTVRRLLEASLLVAPATKSFIGPIKPEEVERLDRFVVEAAVSFDEKVHCPQCANPIVVGPGAEANCVCPYCGKRWDRSAKYQEDTATQALLKGSSKCCPNCGLHVTHYHGHGCHHISPGGGCKGCGQHFCYVCCRKHGKPGERQWHKDCEHRMSFCKSNNLADHIRLKPFPHDSRCGCPICPDCKPGKPCPQCNGSCVVCRGQLPPGGLRS